MFFVNFLIMVYCIFVIVILPSSAILTLDDVLESKSKRRMLARLACHGTMLLSVSAGWLIYETNPVGITWFHVLFAFGLIVTSFFRCVSKKMQNKYPNPEEYHRKRVRKKVNKLI